MFRVEVLDQHELLFDRPSVGNDGLLLGRLDEAVNATVQRINLVRVDVGTADSVDAIVAKFDVILSDFGGVGTLPDPLVAVDLVVAHGHSIVEKDGTGSGRAGRRGRLLLQDGLCRGHASAKSIMGAGEDSYYLVDAKPSRLGGFEDCLAGAAVHGCCRFELRCNMSNVIEEFFFGIVSMLLSSSLHMFLEILDA